jgi:hypothetical protein
MKKFIQNFAVLFFGFLLTAQVFGQLEGNPENFCRNGFFPRESENYKIAKIKGIKGEKVYFYGDDREDCPGGKDCRLKSYLIPNDEVIVSRSFGNFACGWFQPRKGSETVGWIETEKLEWVETVQNPAQKEWFGEWRHYDNSIRISKSKTAGLFDIKGNAIWKGLGDNINIGGLDHKAKPSGNTLKFGEPESDKYGCRVRMFLVGKYLIVSDNLQCGGANVSFSGVYLKKPKK